MKKLRWLLPVAALVVCLCACGGTGQPVQTTAPLSTEETQERQPLPYRPSDALAGVWENSGNYSDGRSFVETLTLNADGTARIHLDYEGEDYATLTGTYEAEDGVLTVVIDDEEEPYEKVYAYVLSGDSLTLQSDEKTVTYTRVY